jgi:hypothetical protein
MTDSARLSKLLWEAREICEKYYHTTLGLHVKRDDSVLRVYSDIDDYRAERGWSPNGFGGETE